MSNFKFLLGVMVFFGFSLTSCNSNAEGSSKESTETQMDNSSIQKDASDLVHLQCKVSQLIGEAKNGSKTALMESEDFNQKAAKLSRELKEKYTTPKEKEKFAKAYEEALGECE